MVESIYESKKDDLVPVASLLMLRLLKLNPHLTELLATQSAPTLVDVRKALSGKKLDLTNLFPESEEVEKLWRREEGEVGDEFLLQLIGRWISDFQSWVSESGNSSYSNIGSWAARLVDFHTAIAPALLVGIEHVNGLLKLREVTPEQYRTALRSLYSLRLVTNVGTVFWCRSCDDEPFVAGTTSRLSPEHLSTTKCPKCTLEACAATAYEVDPLLLRVINANDGLLGVAVAWLLHSNDVSYETSVYLSPEKNNYELDVQFTIRSKHYLIECKMFKSARDREAVVKSLTSAVRQAIAHADATDGKFYQVFVVVNFVPDHDVVDHVMKSSMKGVKKHRVEIVPAKYLPVILGKLSER